MDDFTFYWFFYVAGFATLVIACIGLLLNASGIYFLFRKKGHKNMFNILLIVNLVFDTMYLAFQTARSLNTHFISFTTSPSATYYILANSSERFTYIASVLSLVALAHSRYQVVTDPYKGRRIKLFWSVRRRQLMTYLLPTIFIATSFTVPVIFEIDTAILTSSEEETVHIIPSEIRSSPYYSIFVIGLLNVVVLGIFPFFSLLYYTFYIKKSLNQRFSFIQSHPVKNTREGKTFHYDNAVASENSERDLKRRYSNTNNDKASKTLFLMIFTFVLLHSLRLVANVGELIVVIGKDKTSNNDLQQGQGIPEWLQVVATLGNMFMTLNASVNYLIYLYLNSKKKIELAPISIRHCLKSTLGSEQDGRKPVATQDQRTQKTLSDSFVEVNNTYDCNPISKCLIECKSNDVENPREGLL